MPLQSTQPVTVPATTFDLWGLERFEMTVRPDGVVDAGAVLRRCNETSWSADPSHAIYLRNLNLVAKLVQIGDPAALAAMQQVQDGLLLIAGVLMDAEGVR